MRRQVSPRVLGQVELAGGRAHDDQRRRRRSARTCRRCAERRGAGRRSCRRRRRLNGTCRVVERAAVDAGLGWCPARWRRPTSSQPSATATARQYEACRPSALQRQVMPPSRLSPTPSPPAATAMVSWATTWWTSWPAGTASIQPRVVAAPHPADVHVDQQAVGHPGQRSGVGGTAPRASTTGAARGWRRTSGSAGARPEPTSNSRALLVPTRQLPPPPLSRQLGHQPVGELDRSAVDQRHHPVVGDGPRRPTRPVPRCPPAPVAGWRRRDRSRRARRPFP